jgi:hypothetical protein
MTRGRGSRGEKTRLKRKKMGRRRPKGKGNVQSGESSIVIGGLDGFVKSRLLVVRRCAA